VVSELDDDKDSAAVVEASTYFKKWPPDGR
jgi:hypothetical protein